MQTSYRDILNRISEPPQWFDEHAVPRYCEFAPQRCSEFNCSEAVLAEITCQACHKIYRVAFSLSDWGAKQRNGRRLIDDIVERTLDYGDPPAACCDVGASMSSEPRRVLEYWRRQEPQYVEGRMVRDPAYVRWRRDPSLEMDIKPDCTACSSIWKLA